MAKYITFVAILFTLMAIVEINAQDLDQLQAQLGEQLNNAQKVLEDLGADSNEHVQKVLEQANSKLAEAAAKLNGSACLNFSFVTVIMSLFYAYIVA